MTLVCDTSPLSYLILIEEVGILGTLAGDVCIPPAVREELGHPDGPVQTRNWIKNPPSWLRVEESSKNVFDDVDSKTAEALQSLDRGERQAIQLAESIEARLLVIDERDGRRLAKQLGLRVTGTIGVLDAAASKELVDASEVASRLRETSFRASSELYEWLLERHP